MDDFKKKKKSPFWPPPCDTYSEGDSNQGDPTLSYLINCDPPLPPHKLRPLPPFDFTNHLLANSTGYSN